MGERIQLVAPDVPFIDQEAGATVTLNQWITKNPQRAKETASQLLTVAQAGVFVAIVEGTFQGVSIKEIAKNNKRTYENLRTVWNTARKSLSEKLNLTLESPQNRLDLRRTLEDQRRKKLFDSAQEGNVEAFIQLLSPFGTAINTQTQHLSPELKPAIIAEVLRRVRIDIANIEWQGTTKFRHRLYKIVQSIIVSQFRKELRNGRNGLEITKNPINNSHKPPRDLLNLWIEKHPDRYRELISSLTERQRLIFKAATMDHLSMEKIKTRSGAVSINAVKVTLNRVRVNLAKKAGIHLPESYRPISHFAQRGVPLERLRGSIAAGEIKGALRFLGRYYLTEQIFERNFAEKLLSKRPEGLATQKAINRLQFEGIATLRQSFQNRPANLKKAQ